ncbi:PQQ-dependent sugar dehydrogenase [Solirubrobacter sp. CPCC 204708]|uniref:PQQ-dependent sugar dehydrogenase n=1 Tax=Solirubrobacter deserti TaxID=2282478 RepID=A0ABT4RC64_9ACTN|nr:PQQ-dependent sugar dehydrogenase [Solirubrobacter deserti]MDA0136118.1 PQQ-dependent sugar dehydrogenase [Solirubrobacter deserti]
MSVLLAAVVLAGCGSDQPEPKAAARTVPTTPPATATPEETPGPSPTATPRPPARRVIATGLDVPWGIAFLPDGDALVAERSTARVLRIDAGGGEPRRVMTVPGVARGAGEGGLLGLAVSPAYARDRWVYAYLTSTQGDNRIVRFRLGERVRPVLTGLRSAGVHNGGRIAFGPDGKLYAGVGDAGDTSLSQSPSSRNGKILRMDPDGDNVRVWSLGHRNVQGLAWDRRGRLWASEFGQNARDEVNLIRRGRNYGWPEVEGVGPTGGRFTNPEVTWSTSEASPSGAAIIGRNLYVAALQGECVWKVPLDGASAGKPTRMLSGRYGRIRTVVAAPDGTLWVATSNRDGRGSPRDGDDRIIAVRVA